MPRTSGLLEGNRVKVSIVGLSCHLERHLVRTIPAYESAGARTGRVYAISQLTELIMGRRKELKGICNDLLDSFVSRYNDIDGFWALGKFQAFLQTTHEEQLQFHLTREKGKESVFQQTLDYYRLSFQRHLKVRNLSDAWIDRAVITVASPSSSQLDCILKIKADNGRVFEAKRLVAVRPHKPGRELQRRINDHGPSNQKGV